MSCRNHECTRHIVSWRYSRTKQSTSTFKAVFGNIIHVFLDFGNLFVKALLDTFSNVFWKDLFEFLFTVMKMQFNYNTKI